MKTQAEFLRLALTVAGVTAAVATSRWSNVVTSTTKSVLDRQYDSIIEYANPAANNAPEFRKLYFYLISKDAEKVYLFGEKRRKRYTSYLTLCHFKICNMGRKRTARYYNKMNALIDQQQHQQPRRLV